MLKLLHYICLIVAMCFMPLQVFAVRYLNFVNYQSTNGLSSNSVVDLCADAHGFVWAATDYGISRFDGAVFRNYNTDIYKSLYNNNVIQLCPLDNGDLIVSGYNGFLQRYDCRADSFCNVAPKAFTQAVGRMSYDKRHQTVYALSSAGVLKYQPKDEAFSPFPQYDEGSISTQYIFNDWFDHYWVIESHSLKVYSKDNKKVLLSVDIPSSVLTSAPQIIPLPDNRIFACFQTKQVDIYKVTADKIVSEKRVSLPFDNVRSICRTSDGAFWYASDGNGLWHTSAEPSSSSDFEHILPYGVREQEFSKLYALLADNNDNIWVGTQNSGLWRYAIGGAKLAFSSADLGIPNCQSTNFCQLPNGHMLTSCDGLGIYEFDENATFTKLYDESAGLTNKNLTSLCCDAQGNVLAGTWGGGLYKASFSGNKVFSAVPFIGINNPMNSISYITQMADGTYWVAVGGDGLYVGHPGQWHRQPLIYESGIAELWTGKILDMGKGKLWISASCSLWSADNGKFSPFNVSLFVGEDAYTLNDIEDVPGFGLVCATNKGLVIADMNSHTLKPLQGCPCDAVHSLLVDSRNRIWATVANSIWCFDLKSKKSFRYPRNFDVNGQNFFVNRSCFLSRSGRAYFGTKQGFFCVNTNEVSDGVKSHALLSFSRLTTDGHLLNIPVSFAGDQQMQKVTLSYGHSSFSACVDMVDFSQLRSPIVYRLNADEAWQRLGPDQEITFNYLPTGSYHLQVKTLDADEADALCLNIVVLAPWWQTWWFRILCVALILLIIGYRMYSINRDRKLLKSMVSDRTRELEQQSALLEKRNQDLNEALTTKDRLMAVVAHDLKNPVFAIVGGLQNLQSHFSKMPAEAVSAALGTMVTRTRTVQDELGRLLDWATAKHKDQDFLPANVNLADVIVSDVDLLQIQAGEKGVCLLCDVDLQHYVYADARMLSAAIRNVVSNSIKFTPSGKSVTVRARQAAEWTVVEVTDQGVGIEADKLQQLLSAGTHESTLGTSGESGTGLGIGLAKYYTEMNGGSFQMSSTVGVGTTTVLKFKSTDVVVETATPTQSQVISGAVDTELLQGNCVLVVDDDPLIAQNVKSMLGDYVDVLVANNGQEALEAVKQHQIDIVLSDVEMPVMNGIELSRALVADSSTNHIPVLFLSARTSESDRLMGLLTGAVDYIPKPFSQGELLMKLNNILSLRQRQQQHLLAEAVKSAASGSLNVETQNTAIDNNSNEHPAEPVAEKINPYLQQVVDVIQQNYMKADYGVEELASDLCTTRVTLYRKLKSLSGQNPIELLNEYRLNRAYELLKQGGVPLQDVAYQTGFSDYTYFSRKFKARFGCPPKDVAAE